MTGGEFDRGLFLFYRFNFIFVRPAAEDFVTEFPEVGKVEIVRLDENFAFLLEQADEGAGAKVLMGVEAVGGES